MTGRCLVVPNLCPSTPCPALLHIGCASGFSGDRSDGAPAVVRTLARGGTLIFETLAERTLALAQLARNEDPRLSTTAMPRSPFISAAPPASPATAATARPPWCTLARGGGTLIFETLAERTLALAQLARNEDPRLGYEPLLDDLVGPVLGDCQRHGIAIVSNFGAANPQARRGASRNWPRGRAAAHRGGARRCAGRARTARPAAPTAGRGAGRPGRGQRDRVPGRGRDRPGVGRGRADRGRRPRGGSFVDAGTGAGPFRLGRGRLAPSGTRHHRRPHAGMRPAGHGRLLQRAGLEGRAGSAPSRLPHRRDPVRWRVRHRQGRRHRRHGRCPHGQGTAAVRSPRSRPLSDAGRDRRPEPGPRGRAGRRPRGGARRHRSCPSR